MTDVRLMVNGREYAGWKSARVTRGIESIAGSFELAVSDRWAGQDASWPIGEEDACEVWLGKERVISGYVDRRSLAYGPAEHSLSVSGRDKAGALVDCSALLGKWEFIGVPLLTLAKRLTEPFGIRVSLQAGLVLPKPSAKFSINPGDSVFEVLDRVCRLAGVLPVSDGAGGLVLTRAGASRASTALVEGENILAASADFDSSGRFARYVVLAQHKGTDDFSGEGAATVKGTAHDANVRRTERVLVVRPEGNATSEHAKKRAEWEATVRAARGDSVGVTVQGWTQASGRLWPVNALVAVRSKRIGVSGDMLITAVTYEVSAEGGTTSRLTLRPPNAFKPEPTVAKASGVWKEIAGGA
jgi:prophage tail gpP-like protein